MWLKYVCVNTNLTGWTVLDSVLSACNYYMCLKLEKKYFPQFPFLISFRLALTEGGICMRLEDGSRVETILLSIDGCMDIWRSPAPRSSSPLLVLSNNSGLKHDSALSVRDDSFERPLHEFFVGPCQQPEEYGWRNFPASSELPSQVNIQAMVVSGFIYPTLIFCTSISPAIIFIFPTVVLTLLFPG